METSQSFRIITQEYSDSDISFIPQALNDLGTWSNICHHEKIKDMLILTTKHVEAHTSIEEAKKTLKLWAQEVREANKKISYTYFSLEDL